MPGPARVFVSHSSHDGDLTNALCGRLQCADSQCEPVCQALVDNTALVPGKEWPKQIHEFMAKCHAGVILLTEHALASAWVLKEATILAWRASIDESFHLFVVQGPGVTNARIADERFGPLLLDSIQKILLCQGCHPTDDDIEHAARRIRETIGCRPVADTPFDRLVGGLADLFGKVGDHTLLRVAEKVRVGASAWRPDRDRRTQYVEEIARRIVCESLGHYKGIDELVDDLSSTTPVETLKQILAIAAPRWVDLAAAGRLPQLATKPQRAAIINGSCVAEFTADMYVKRAHPLSNKYRVIQAGGGFAGDPADHYTREICALVRKRENRTDADDAIIAYLNRRNQSLYVLLPPPLLPDEALGRLLNRFPRLSFILWSGEKLEDSDSHGDIDRLVPEVDLELEERELDSYRDAQAIIRNMEEEGWGRR